MPHLDCVPVPVAVPHPTVHPSDIEMGFEQTKGQQKQQQQPPNEEHANNNGSSSSKGPTMPTASSATGKEAKRKSTAKGVCQQPVTEESLSQFQLDKLAELRAQLGDQLLEETPLFNDTFSLLRWLYGWNYRIDEIVPRFKKASSMFRCMRVNGLKVEDVDELNDFTRSLTLAADHFPGGVLGHDREGNVVTMQMMGQSHPKQLSKCGRISDVYRLSVVETAQIYQLIRLQERKHRRKLGLRVIIDLDGFNSDHLTTMGMKVYGSLLKCMQDLFPDVLRQVYMVNAHYLVKTAYTIIKPVLSEQSREKVVFMDSQFHEQLAKDIGPENLPAHWGGTRLNTRGHPRWGTLRPGGPPPPHMRYCSITDPNHMADSRLQRILVPARQKREVTVPVPDPGPHLLRWFWTSSSDIDFGLLTDEDVEVWPVLRLLTDLVPEFGCLRVQGDRVYKFLFDNSFSTFTKKEVKFGFKLEAFHAKMAEESAVDGCRLNEWQMRLMARNEEQKMPEEKGKANKKKEKKTGEEEKENAQVDAATASGITAIEQSRVQVQTEL